MLDGRNTGTLLLLLLFLLKYYPQEKTVEQKWKMFDIDLDTDLKERSDLKSKCCFTLLEPVMPGP